MTIKPALYSKETMRRFMQSKRAPRTRKLPETLQSCNWDLHMQGYPVRIVKNGVRFTMRTGGHVYVSSSWMDLYTAYLNRNLHDFQQEPEFCAADRSRSIEALYRRA